MSVETKILQHNKQATFQLVADFLKNTHKPLIVIVGPTASGKTALSIELAQKFNGEIISADSRQIFRKLDIGTAKITSAEMQGIPHYGIDLRAPEETFSVAEFKTYAQTKITEILARQKIPILAGGTGLYVNALTQNFTIPKVPANWELRTKLEKLSSAELHQKLEELDPVEAQKIHPNNKRYLIRALEINKTTGKKKSEIMQKKQNDFEILILSIQTKREILYQKINQRVEEMFVQGLEKEVRSLIAQGYDFQNQAFNAVGYREIKAYLEGKMTYSETVALIQKNTRNYAKRQLTWWRQDKRLYPVEL